MYIIDIVMIEKIAYSIKNEMNLIKYCFDGYGIHITYIYSY